MKKRGNPSSAIAADRFRKSVMREIGLLLAAGCTHAMIAEMLNNAGRTTATGKAWTAQHVANLLFAARHAKSI